MTAPILQAPVSEPALADLLNAFKREIFASLNCHQWGIVQSFDASKQTAVIKIAALRQVPQAQGDQVVLVGKAYPLLSDVPVFVPAGGAGALTFPVAAGDLCLVLFNDRDFDAFWATGNVEEPPSGRLHDLSDGLAIVGFRTKAAPLAGYDPSQVVLKLGTTNVTLGSKVGITNATISLLTVLTNLITTLKAFKDTHGDTPDATTLANLTSSQTDITNLLQ